MKENHEALRADESIGDKTPEAIIFPPRAELHGPPVAIRRRFRQQTDKIWDARKAMLQHIQPDEWRAILSGARAAEEKKAPKK